MVKAIRGEKGSPSLIPIALTVAPGVLIEVDPAIKAIILDIDKESHDFVIEDLDETHLLIKENMHDLLKQKLDEVSRP